MTSYLLATAGRAAGAAGRVCASAGRDHAGILQGHAARDARRSGGGRGGGRAEHLTPAETVLLVFLCHVSLLFAHEAVVGTSAVAGSPNGCSDHLALVGDDRFSRALAAVFAPAHGRGRKRLALLALEPHLDHVRAALVVVVQLLAMHAVDALVDIDLPLGMDRLHRAFLGAALARRAAFGPALQPLEHADPAGDRERRAERAEIAAEEALDEQAGRQAASGRR